MSNIIKRFLTIFVVVGLLCSIQVVNGYSARTAPESDPKGISEAFLGNESYAKYRTENSGFEYANEDIVLEGADFAREENSEVKKLAEYEG